MFCLPLYILFIFLFQRTSKISLGFGGVVMVFASVLASVGIFGYIRVPTTIITLEVSSNNV